MRVLALDTASTTCGVALLVDGLTRSQMSLALDLTHAQALMAVVDSVLDLAAVSITQIDLIAVTRGPGSFTGLRIGAAAAKGLALALDKPLVGVSSLETLAHQSPTRSTWVCSMLDARRGQVYWALYEPQGNGWAIRGEERVGPALDAVAGITSECTFIGNGAVLYADSLRGRLCVAAHWVVPEFTNLNPAVVGRLGVEHWRAGRWEPAEDFVPVYIRKSDARLVHNRI